MSELDWYMDPSEQRARGYDGTESPDGDQPMPCPECGFPRWRSHGSDSPFIHDNGRPECSMEAPANGEGEP